MAGYEYVILTDAESLLAQMLEYPQHVCSALAELGFEQQVNTVGRFRNLHTQVEQLENDNDLFMLADSVIALIENVTPLCHLLLPGEEEVQLRSEQEQRNVTLSALSKVAESQRQDYINSHKAGILNLTLQLRTLLDQAIPPERILDSREDPGQTQIENCSR